MSEEQSVGRHLRREREQRGISLRQISDTTRIQMRYLEALEEDRFDIFLVESHIKNFIMTYARTIQIDDDVPLALFDSMMAEERERERGEQLQIEQSRRRRRKRRLVVAAVVVLVCLAAAFAVSTRLMDSSPDEARAPQSQPEAVAEPSAAQPEAAVPQSPSTPIETPSAAPVEPVESPLTVIGRVLISGHGLNSWGSEYWWTYSWVRLAGVSQPDDLRALSYLTPDGKLVDLEPELSESGVFSGRFVYSDRNLEKPPPLGDYRFVLVDSNGLEKRFTIVLDRVLANLPVMIHPRNNQEVSATDLEISWEAVPETISYTLHVKTMNNERLWVRRGISGTSLSFNDDGEATVEILSSGRYIISVYAQDRRGNMAVRHISFSVVS